MTVTAWALQGLWKVTIDKWVVRRFLKTVNDGGVLTWHSGAENSTTRQTYTEKTEWRLMGMLEYSVTYCITHHILRKITKFKLLHCGHATFTHNYRSPCSDSCHVIVPYKLLYY